MSQAAANTPQRRHLHVMGKPVGPICNLDCKYCFYLDKEKLYPSPRKFVMSDEVLENYVRQYIASQPGPEVSFAWQGGEPTLLGVGYFRKVVELQARYANGKTIGNSIQTNGTLLDDAWCKFFRENRFLVGISIDGPRELHEKYRVDKLQRSTFDKVMAGVELLKRHAVEFNTLTVVHHESARRPLDVYRFLKEIGSTYIQFIPLVERSTGAGLAGPPLLSPSADESAIAASVTPWSVDANDYGNFLVEIFQEWVRHDVGWIFVQVFETALSNWMGLGSTLCIFAETCGRALALEHNGDVYSCDHYVYPSYKLGNLLDQEISVLADLPSQQSFGNAKRDSLPDYCRQCEVRFACNGECPRNRFLVTPDGQPGLNYLCAGYRHFFRTIDPTMKELARLLRAGRPAADIMNPRVAASPARVSTKLDPSKVARNAPCPCGSGIKYKRCHGKSS
jgi:uncharacterized protein